MQRFEDLKVWQRARELVRCTYELVATFPTSEKYVLGPQMRRCAVSIAANIAEGSKRRGAKDFAHFLNMAEGSASELQCLVILASDLKLLTADPKPFRDMIDEVERMLFSLRDRIEKEGR